MGYRNLGDGRAVRFEEREGFNRILMGCKEDQVRLAGNPTQEVQKLVTNFRNIWIDQESG